MINYLAWLGFGALVGLLTTRIIHRNKSILWINIIVGCVSAFIFGYLLLPLLNISTTHFSFLGLLVALVAETAVLLAINFKYREHTTTNAVMRREWDQVRSKIHARWGKITHEDIEWIDGDHDRFIQLLQKRYEISNEDAEDQLQRFLGAVTYIKFWNSLPRSSNQGRDAVSGHNHTSG